MNNVDLVVFINIESPEHSLHVQIPFVDLLCSSIDKA